MGRTPLEMIVKYSNGDDVPADVLIPSSLNYQADAEKDPALAPKSVNVLRVGYLLRSRK